MLSLENKVAVITGGGSGIGLATAKLFAKRGASVVIAERDEDTGVAAVSAIEAEGGTACFIRTDVTEFSQVEAAVNLAVEQYGRLDVMFNNAGAGIFKPLLDTEPEEFDLVVRVNLHGVYHGILSAGRKMRDLGIAGVIINTTSVYAYIGSKGVVGYHAAKGGAKTLTQAAALELAPLGIRVVGIAPGTVNTPIIQGYIAMGMEERLAKAQMRKKIIEPEQVAEVVAFLATDAADAINGSVLPVDDGLLSFKF
ncbi:MAG: SDR family oxidoreductase [Myxococcales bacterium]|nr:SDR family oxidoreductase [Myxococcales bacterium]